MAALARTTNESISTAEIVVGLSVLPIYIDVLNRQAITSPTNPAPMTRPDFRASQTYPIQLYFLRGDGAGNYNYIRYQQAVLALNLRMNAPVDTARFSLAFQGAETAVIDSSLSNTQIVGLLEALPTIGVGNVLVTGAHEMGWKIEFIGALAGQILPAITARVVSNTPAAEINVSVLPVTIADQVAATTVTQSNSQQLVVLRRAPLASTTSWTEIGVPTTPGWSGTLDTTGVPLSAWDQPIGDIVLELILSAANTRSGIDGVTVSDVVGRAGSDGQIIMSPGVSGQNANASDNGTTSFLVAADGNGVYGRKFVPSDVGRTVTDTIGYILAGTVVAGVIDDGIINAAQLSQQLGPVGMTTATTITYTLSNAPSDVFYSPTANWTTADIGHVLASGPIPSGARIIAVINPQYIRLSQPAMMTGTGLTWNLIGDILNIFQSGSAFFTPADVGSRLRAPLILPNDAVITGFISASQVQLSSRPSISSPSVPWTLIPARPYPPATVTSLLNGSSSQAAIQKIALAQVSSGGLLAVQDGYGGDMPIVVINNPVMPGDFQNKLNAAYPNYGGCTVLQVLPGAEWNITFGYTGAQRLLAVDDTQSIYDPLLLSWTLEDAVALPMTTGGARIENPTGSPPVIARNGLFYIGFSSSSELKFAGMPRFTRLTDGTNAVKVTQRRIYFADTYQTPALNTGLGNMGGYYNGQYGNFLFVGDEGGEERNGLYYVDWVGVTMPRTRFETHQQQRSLVGDIQGKSGNVLIDQEFYTMSQSTWMVVVISYFTDNQGFVSNGQWIADGHTPSDGPAATLVHFFSLPGTIPLPPRIILGNGAVQPTGAVYTTIGVQYIQSWSRRLWMGGIWEQRANVN